jgi:hypothetical protein
MAELNKERKKEKNERWVVRPTIPTITAALLLFSSECFLYLFISFQHSILEMNEVQIHSNTQY